MIRIDFLLIIKIVFNYDVLISCSLWQLTSKKNVNKY